MAIVLYISIGFLLMILGTTLFNFFSAPQIARAPALKSEPKVSVLIPARNEAHNIGQCLEGMTRQNYTNLEIIVLNDASEDDTEKVVQQWQRKDERIQLLHGKPLQAGWSGKNWACHQLSKAATGDILIFTDADNHHAPDAMKNTVAYIQKYGLGLISAFPQQWTVTLAEKLIVPIMDIFVYGTLPLWLTYYAPFPSMAAANGQWLAFARDAYQKLGGHSTVKNELVEDTVLSRIAKKQKIKILTTAGTGAVFCRMYQNREEIWQGFSKNFYGLAGYNNVVFFSIILMMFVAFILPYVLWIFPAVRELSMAAVSMNIFMRAIISMKYKHPFWVSVLLHPVGMFYAVLIGLNSFLSIRRGIIQWKGRQIQIAK